MAFDHAKFLARFVEEAKDHCSRLSEGLLTLETAAEDDELLNALFRSAHTIKGSSRMMKLAGITELAHRMEDVLDAVRSRTIKISQALTDLLLQGVDALAAQLAEVAAGNKTPEAPEKLCEELGRAAAGEAVSDHRAPHLAAIEPAHGPEPASPSRLPQAVVPGGRLPSAEPGERLPQVEPGDQPPPAAPGGRVPSAGPGERLSAEFVAGKDPAVAPVRAGAAPAKAVPVALAAAGCEGAGGVAPAKGKISEYLRVNAGKLDDLIRLMGEIVSEHGKLKSQLARVRKIGWQTGRLADQFAGDDGAAAPGWRELRRELRGIHDSFHLQEHLVADLQHLALNLRMQPLAAIFDPLRRTVRDLARERGREVDFVVEGGETELDRKIIERIGDSLTHMIRNALDHGLESPAEREASGKPKRGMVRLGADYDSTGVCITLSDDGKGIAVERIREKVLQKKLYDPETLAGMSQGEIINLIFLPGFSTSPIITDLSGRGVGMDVVRKNIVDELRGAVEIASEEGKGTAVTLRLPLNLAVFSLFLVETGGRRLALPATSLVEMLSVRPGELIEIVNSRAVRLRNQLIPVIELAAILQIPPDLQGAKADKAAEAAHTEGWEQELTLVIVRDGDDKLGLLVDHLVGREEMVVKPLPAHLQGLRLLAGLTIGERDQVINVLHVPELIRRGRAAMGQGIASPTATAESEQSYHILVVDDSLNTREIEKSILEAYGYQVETAEDGRQALEKTGEILYDMVITDVEMPRLDGFSLTEKLRADERYREVPIIIVTSREKDEDKRRGISVGADAYIVKGSFDQSNLLDTVRSLLG